MIRDFHPLVFFYVLGPDDARARARPRDRGDVLRFNGNAITAADGRPVALLLISGLQFTLFAMWFDMESNKDLR